MTDLFDSPGPAEGSYSARDIEVLEGLEPVRRRPGMYVGGTDERALHHLVAELLDNAMDEAVAGQADRIGLRLGEDGSVTVSDNGRGIPVDPHPQYGNKTALEVILTTLHAGGKFHDKAYATAGGLHGVGLSVVNALAAELVVEVARDRRLYRQRYARGQPQGPPEDAGRVQNRRGTSLTFRPDPAIFGEVGFQAERLYRLARSKAYLYRGVTLDWRCPAAQAGATVPAEARLHFPGGLADYLAQALENRAALTPQPFTGEVALPDGRGKLEWAIAWPADEDGFCHSYVNTVPTPQGGTHESGVRTALVRALKAHGELVGNKRAGQLTAEDVCGGACLLISLFLREPQFQGQMKEKLASPEASRLIDQALKDRFEHWLSADPSAAQALLGRLVERSDERQRRRKEKELQRKTATRKTRLPGKLADCARSGAEGTELFLVEGDSAGGSAKQARDRDTQAVLPLKGKILNVASASRDKLQGNQEVNDIRQALGCGTRDSYRPDRLRYERVIVMTDADVDGAHIAALLMTYFYQEMPGLIADGRLYLAMPPLYRLQHGELVRYARDEAHKDALLAETFKNPDKVQISRFKGLGEMPAKQLKETTMEPAGRALQQVYLPRKADPEEADAAQRTEDLVTALMGRKAELRFRYIRDNARFAHDLDV